MKAVLCREFQIPHCAQGFTLWSDSYTYFFHIQYSSSFYQLRNKTVFREVKLVTFALFLINSITASYAELLRFPWLASTLEKEGSMQGRSATTIACNYLSTHMTKTCFAGPIKIQIFDNYYQTSRFTHPLGNILTPLHKLLK